MPLPLRTGLCAALLASCTSLISSAPVASAQALTGTLLPHSTLYPRLVRLEHGPDKFRGEIVASTNGNIFLSTNQGKSFSFVKTVPAASGSTERCCGTIYEMPRAVGSLAAGTLLYAASYFHGITPAIEIYVSNDRGRTWEFSSMPVSRGDSTHGLWEPDFTITVDGALAIFWSDETDPCCSQKLAQARTYDGTTWQDETNTVRSALQPDRPGIAVVSKLPGGTYFMSYELCGPAACTIFDRTSTDGWNYGDPANVGMRVQTTTGQYLEHAATNVWTPDPDSQNGAILLVGQVLFDANGAESSQNGQVLFVNTAANGSGDWTTIPAPVKVPTSYNNYCPNYESALLPSVNGNKLLEFASDYNSAGICLTYFATKPLRTALTGR